MVLHAGDFSLQPKTAYAQQLAYFENQFCPWARRVASEVPFFYYINGNHEVFAEKLNINTDYNDVTKNHCIDMTEVSIYPYGKKVTLFGNPYTPYFGGWGFNAEDSPEDLGKKLSFIPDDTDILLSHGPPYGILDLVPERISLDWNTGQPIEIPSVRAGSKELLKRVKQIRPKLCIFGHLHANAGVIEQDGTTFIACAQVNESYENTRQPIVIEI